MINIDNEKVELSENSRSLFKIRYCDEGESVESRLFDMVLNVASAEILDKHKLFKNDIQTLRKMYYDFTHQIWDNKYFNALTQFCKYVDLYWEHLIKPLNFLPNSPTIVNAGKNKGSLSACFVNSPQDTMMDILRTQLEWGMIEKWGGGIGGFFGNIREKDSQISTTHGKALGPVAVMKMYSYQSMNITQGSFREGAHMGQMQFNHPDIIEFIHCKDNVLSPKDILSNFNISVQVTDEFMLKVKEEDWQHTISLVSPNNNKITGEITVGQLWNSIINSAWKTGDPGLVFVDRIRETEPNPHLGLIESSNPCVAKGTKIGSDYPNNKMVEDIKINDIILCYNPMKMKIESNTADSIEIHENFPVWKVKCENNIEIRVTASHKFHALKKINITSLNDKFNIDKFSYISLLELSPGDYITCLFNTDISSVKIEYIIFDGYDTVYDIKNNKFDNWWTNGLLSQGCGEEFLENYGSCNLGSINLSNFVCNGNIEYNYLRKVVKLAVRFLDSVITVNQFPNEVPELREINLKTRRIGLGIMGWNDVLSMLNIPYDSEDAIKQIEKLGSYIQSAAIETSEELAEELGRFPEWHLSKLNNGVNKPRRNSSVTTIAPTGTISILSNCSSGIEPYFAYIWERDAIWEQGKAKIKLQECPKYLNYLIDKSGFDKDWFLYELKDLTSKENPDYNYIDNHFFPAFGINGDLFKPSYRINPEWHLKHLAAWQNSFATNSVSKTINLPEEYTSDEIGITFLQAWEMRCKAITVYRNNSKQQVLNLFIKESVDETEKGIAELDKGNYVTLEELENNILNNKKLHEKESSPEELPAVRRKVKTGHGNLYVTVAYKDNIPSEVFINIGKQGGCHGASLEAIGRLISLHLRCGGNIDDIVEELRNISCCPVYYKGKQIMSPADGVSYALAPDSSFRKDVKENEVIQNLQEGDLKNNIIICPDCDNKIITQEKCPVCQNCGWSRCG